MKKLLAAAVIILALLGVQRTPEAMDPSPIIGGAIIPAAGCVHAAMRMQHQPTAPVPTPSPPAEETPATIP